MAEDRTLFINIHVYEYSISWEELDRIFSPIENIEYIEVFDQGSPFHSRIRFAEPQSAIKAFECYDERFIYDGCCIMELSLGDGADDRLSEIDVFGSCTEEPNMESGDKNSFPMGDLVKLMKTMVQAESGVEVARGFEFTSSPSKALALASSAIEEDTIGINPCHPLVSKLDDNPQKMKVNSVSLEVPDDYVEFEEVVGLFVDSVDYIKGIPIAFVQSNSLPDWNYGFK